MDDVNGITRRNLVVGGAVAAAAAGIAATGQAETALAAHDRADGAGNNAGWGDTELTDGLLDTPFGDVIDNWFQYSWSYTAEFEPQPERDCVTILVSSSTIGGNGETLAGIVADEIGDAADVETVYLRDLMINLIMTINGQPPVEQTNGIQDGMTTVIDALKRANIVVAIAPTYYNNPDGRMMTALTCPWSACWTNPDYQWGPPSAPR